MLDPRTALADLDDLRCMMAFLGLAADSQPDEAGILARVLCYVMPLVSHLPKPSNALMCHVMPLVARSPWSP